MKRILVGALSFMMLLSILSMGEIMVNAESISIKMVGDLDQDEEITDWDGVLLARFLAGWPVNIVDEKVLDIDGDGEITDWDGVMFDRYLAGWSVSTQVGNRLTYAITYENTKNAVNTNPTSYENDDTIITLKPLSAEHYTFAGWYIGNEKITNIPTEHERELTITAHWTPIDYTITYQDTQGASNNNPSKYNIESNEIVLHDLVCSGYTFGGWYRGNEKVTVIPTGTTGNITLTAKWTACDYTITYENTRGVDNSNPTSYTAITDTFNLADLQCEGYDFLGWYQGNSKVTSIEKGTTGNINLTAKWTATNYAITYTNTKGAVNTNPAEYNVESGTIYLTDIFAEQYTFKGWHLDDKKVTSIPAGNIGDIELVARWTPDSYNLTYANTKGADNENPGTYTVEDVIILQDISANGYTFDGWYIGEEKITTIPIGSYGNKTLSAKWKLANYSITYQDTKGVEHSNPDTYTMESDTIVLSSLQKEGYTFIGWYNGSEKVSAIKAGSIGDLILTAKWTPLTYMITYQDTRDFTNSNPISYTTDDEIILKDLSVNSLYGYDFDGWYNGDEKVTKIVAGSSGNIVLTAKWSLHTYTITYYDTKGADNPNITSYTIETETYYFQDIACDGYEFDRWTYMRQGSAPTYSGWGFAKGKTGNMYVTAHWIPIEYNITYTAAEPYAEMMSHTNPATYTIESNIVLEPATIVGGYVFGGWYTDAEFTEPITAIEPGHFNNMTLYAKWTPADGPIYEITFKSNYGGSMPDNLCYVVEDGTISLPTIPRIDNAYFYGWCLDGQYVTEIPASIASDITLYAVWIPSIIECNRVSPYLSSQYPNVHVEPENPTASYSTISGAYEVRLYIWGTLYNETIRGNVYYKGNPINMRRDASYEVITYFTLSNYTSSTTASVGGYYGFIPVEEFLIW